MTSKLHMICEEGFVSCQSLSLLSRRQSVHNRVFPCNIFERPQCCLTEIRLPSRFLPQMALESSHATLSQHPHTIIPGKKLPSVSYLASSLGMRKRYSYPGGKIRCNPQLIELRTQPPGRTKRTKIGSLECDKRRAPSHDSVDGEDHFSDGVHAGEFEGEIAI